jgi:hypothetical protein
MTACVVSIRKSRVPCAGLDAVMLDLNDTARFNAELRQAMNDYPGRIGAALSFSGFGVDIKSGAEVDNLWQYLRIPMLTWMLDHPCYLLARHSTSVPAVMRMYWAKDFLDFQRDFVRAPYRTALTRMGVMNYGREPAPPHPKRGILPLILFPKSGDDPAVLEETWKLLPRLMRKIIRDATDHYWGETARSGNVVGSVLAAADAAGVELRNDLTLMTFFVTQLDDYMRRIKAKILIQQILPLPVQVYGKGFDYIDTSKARAQILPPISYQELVDKAFESDVIISMNPNIDDACHDRAYLAFSAGAMPLSEINPWWAAEFPELLPYSYDFRERSLTAAVERFLADPQAASGIAQQHALVCRKERSFDNAVQEILELALMHRYFTFNFEPPQRYYAKHGE